MDAFLSQHASRPLTSGGGAFAASLRGPEGSAMGYLRIGLFQTRRTRQLPISGFRLAPTFADAARVESAGYLALLDLSGFERGSARVVAQSAPHGDARLVRVPRILRVGRLHHLPRPVPLAALPDRALLDGTPSGDESSLRGQPLVRQRGAALVPRRSPGAGYGTPVAGKTCRPRSPGGIPVPHSGRVT